MGEGLKRAFKAAAATRRAPKMSEQRSRPASVAGEIVPPLTGQPAIMTKALRDIAEAAYRRGLEDTVEDIEEVRRCFESRPDIMRILSELKGRIRALADEEG